jgi:hypothetical protein
MPERGKPRDARNRKNDKIEGHRVIWDKLSSWAGDALVKLISDNILVAFKIEQKGLRAKPPL